MEKIEIKCAVCGGTHHIEKRVINRKRRKDPNAKFYCSLSCSKRKLPLIKKCLNCGIEFTPTSKNPKKKFCSVACANRWRKKNTNLYNEHSEKLKEMYAENPMRFWGFVEAQINPKNKFSSKIERRLAVLLEPLGFKRNFFFIYNNEAYDIDIYHPELPIWIESDGPWHFHKVHKNHDFERVKYKDKMKEEIATENGILLIRVDNRKYSPRETVQMIKDKILIERVISGVIKFY